MELIELIEIVKNLCSNCWRRYNRLVIPADSHLGDCSYCHKHSTKVFEAGRVILGK